MSGPQMTAELAHRFLNLSRILATQHVALFYDLDTVFMLAWLLLLHGSVRSWNYRLEAVAVNKNAVVASRFGVHVLSTRLLISTLITLYAFLVGIHVVHII